MIGEYKLQIKKFPEEPIGYSNLANTYILIKKYDEALKVLLSNKNEVKLDDELRHYVAIYLFKNEIEKAKNKIDKYLKLFLVYPDKSVYPYPRRILRGFTKFCLENDKDFEILNDVCDDMVFKKGDLFITIEEPDLVNLINQIRMNELTLGEDIGVISYNDTPLKELLGITVMSTDFKAMGELAAQMILNNERGRVKVPFNFIDRSSV